MSKCPKCNFEVESLNFIQYDKGKGEISLEDDGLKIIRPDKLGRTIYIKCSECNHILFYNLIEAAKWLTGKPYEEQKFPEQFFT